MNNKIVFGINFGSKLTGNTVISIYADNQVLFLDVDKGVDADFFILNAADHFKPQAIFIDAPLSLPGVYQGKNNYNDYHFRQADRQLNAMSPMFLGGLAARAIELKSTLESKGMKVMETYPRVLAHKLKLRAKGYKGSRLALKGCRKSILRKLDEQIDIDAEDINTWHHLDALLALISGLNYIQGKAEIYGNEKEGLIYI